MPSSATAGKARAHRKRRRRNLMKAPKTPV
jgi:hypothetical protein